MPKINVCFQGWINGGCVDHAMSKFGEHVDVSGMDSESLVQKLESGELTIYLGDILYNNDDSNIKLFDFDAPF